MNLPASQARGGAAEQRADNTVAATSTSGTVPSGQRDGVVADGRHDGPRRAPRSCSTSRPGRSRAACRRVIGEPYANAAGALKGAGLQGPRGRMTPSSAPVGTGRLAGSRRRHLGDGGLDGDAPGLDGPAARRRPLGHPGRPGDGDPAPPAGRASRVSVVQQDVTDPTQDKLVLAQDPAGREEAPAGLDGDDHRRPPRDRAAAADHTDDDDHDDAPPTTTTTTTTTTTDDHSDDCDHDDADDRRRRRRPRSRATTTDAADTPGHAAEPRLLEAADRCPLGRPLERA